MNWEKARRRDIVAVRGGVPVDEGGNGWVRTVPKPKPMTTKQSRFYRKLCGQLGRKYDGKGMNAREASEAIDAALLSLRARRH